jgi:uncharacterized membrane protein YsdA (DUF1294 family)
MPVPLMIFYAVNLLTFVLFGWDKWQSTRKGRRIPERVLLGCAFFGGTIAAKAAQLFFNHKTKKQPFKSRLNVILGAQLAVLALFAWV